MVYRVKLVAFDQPQQVRKLQRHDPLGLQQYLQAFDKIV